MNRCALALLAFFLAFSSSTFAEQVVAYKGEVQALNTHDLFYSVGLKENTPSRIDACGETPAYILYFSNETGRVYGWNLKEKRWEQALISELYPQLEGSPIDAFAYILSLGIYEITSGNKAWIIKDGKISDTPYSISEIAAAQCAGLEKCPDRADAIAFYKDAEGNDQFVWTVNNGANLDIWFSKGGALHYNSAAFDKLGFFNGYLTSVDAICTLPPGNLLVFGEGKYTGGSAGEIGENTKLMSKYSDKEVFLVSDKDWHDVLPLVPVTTWTEKNGEVKKYPTLIYHDESGSSNLHVYFARDHFEEGHVIGGIVNFADGFTSYSDSVKFSKSQRLKPGEEISLFWKIYTDGVIESIQLTTIPDFMEFVDPPDGELGNINRAFPNGETSEFRLKVKDDADPGATRSAFDADSIIYFMQQYGAQKATMSGQYPEELASLLSASPELGAGLSQNQLQQISADDYFSYWEKFDTVVYVEDNYELALLASAYASLLNAPLVIEDSSADSQNIFYGRGAICVGTVAPRGMQCAEAYSLEQLRKKYVELTNTDKLLLVNPADLGVAITATLSPEKSGASIYELYGKNSLAAPFLAAAKHELIISTTSTDWESIDNFIDSTITSLGIAPEYLTIVASPNAIDASYLSEDGVQHSADQWNYAETNDGDPYIDFAVGRIFGVTVSDTSANIARSLFYDETLDNEERMLFAMGDPCGCAAGEVYVLGNVMSNAGCITKATPTGTYVADWVDKSFITYLDHGGTTWAGIHSYEIPWLDSSFIFAEACSTCNFDANPSARLFCANAIRRGAVGFIGTVDSSGSVSEYRFLSEIFAGGASVGQAFRSFKNSQLALYWAPKVSTPLNVYEEYELIGDPALHLKTACTLPKGRLDFLGEDGSARNYNLAISAMKFEIPKEIAPYLDEFCTGKPLYFTNADLWMTMASNEMFSAELNPLPPFEPVAISQGWVLMRDFSNKRNTSLIASPNKADDGGYFTSANDEEFTDFDFDITLYSAAPDLTAENLRLSGRTLYFDIVNIGNGMASVVLNDAVVILSYPASSGAEGYSEYGAFGVHNLELSLLPNEKKTISYDIPEESDKQQGVMFDDYGHFKVIIYLYFPETFVQQDYHNDYVNGVVYK